MLDGALNPIHLMIILGVVLVLFGPKRLPEMGQRVGQALRDFKSATSDIRSQIGVDDIADSVNAIKSSLSLTSDSPRTATTIGGGRISPHVHPLARRRRLTSAVRAARQQRRAPEKWVLRPLWTGPFPPRHAPP